MINKCIFVFSVYIYIIIEDDILKRLFCIFLQVYIVPFNILLDEIYTKLNVSN